MKTPINTGLAQTDVDFGNFKPLNANLTDYAGTNVTWNTGTKKFDVPAGDVVGPAGGVVDNQVVLFNATTGKLVKGATGTGIAKHASGVLSLVTAPAGALVGDTDTQALTNKEIVPRVVSVASSATWSPNADTTDVFTVTTAQAAAVTTINNPSGTPVDGQKMMFRVKCDGTARGLTWTGTQYRASTDMALPTTLIASKTTYLGFAYNSLDTKWDLLAKMENF